VSRGRYNEQHIVFAQPRSSLKASDELRQCPPERSQPARGRLVPPTRRPRRASLIMTPGGSRRAQPRSAPHTWLLFPHEHATVHFESITHSLLAVCAASPFPPSLLAPGAACSNSCPHRRAPLPRQQAATLRQAVASGVLDFSPADLPDANTWPTHGALRERLLLACRAVELPGCHAARDAFLAELVRLTPPELARLVRCLLPLAAFR